MLAHCLSMLSFSILFVFFQPTLYLDLVVQATTTTLPATQQCWVQKKKKKCVFCTENRSPTGLVSFNMQNTESVLREMESCASFVFVVLGGWVCGCNSDFPCSHSPVFCVFWFSLRSVSQPCPHYPFSSSIMAQGLLNFFSPGTKFRKSSLTLGPGLMTTSTYCTN